MMHILFVYDLMTTTIEVNLSYINEIFFDSKKRYSLTKDVTLEDLNWCDICYAIRPNSPYAVNIAEAVIKSGRIFISSYDDDLLDLPKGNSSRWKKKYVLACLNHSSAIVSCSPLIINDYREKVSDIPFLLSNSHIKEEDLRPVAMHPDKVRIVYAAGRDHIDLFNEYIKPSLDDLLDKYGEKIEIVLMGIHPNLGKYGEHIQLYDTMPYDEYKQFMSVHHFDLGLAPLYDTPFSNRKYFNKYIEYSKFGIAGLYSNVMPYTFVVRNRENGLLVENSVSEWKRAIFFSIEHILEMKRMAVRAQQQMLANYSYKTQRQLWDDWITELANSQQKKLSVTLKHNKIPLIWYDIKNKYHVLITHLRQEGAVTVVKRVLKIV